CYRDWSSDVCSSDLSINISGNAFTGAAVSGSLNGLGGTNRVPFQPVGNLDVDQTYRVDARLAKKLPFTERITGYLQFEAFNLFRSEERRVGKDGRPC